MEAFEGVFTKRGEAEASSGAFDDVFVRRGRWRQNRAQPIEQIEGDVVDLAENIVALRSGFSRGFSVDSATVEYPMPSLSDITSVDGTEGSHPALIVKNTFVEAADLDFDSLQDFIKERKVKSCPASRQVSNATMLMSEILGVNADSAVQDVVLNTASSFWPTHRLAEVVEDSDPATSEPSADGSFDEAHFNTASTSTSMTEAVLDEHELSPDDRLSSLRTTQPAESMLQQSPNQFFVSVQTPDGIVPGVVTLLGNSQPQQTPLCTPRLSDPPAFNAKSDPSQTMPLFPPPPVAPPTLRLAEAIAPPELGGPELPSIGSLLHHTGECRPCTFFHTRGCENKENCQFCHLCGPREKKKRVKALRAAQREATFLALEQAQATLASWTAAEAQAFQVETIVE